MELTPRKGQLSLIAVAVGWGWRDMGLRFERSSTKAEPRHQLSELGLKATKLEKLRGEEGGLGRRGSFFISDQPKDKGAGETRFHDSMENPYAGEFP